MTKLSRQRKRHLKDFSKRVEVSGDSVREIGRWRLIDVHETIENPPLGTELDFWCGNGKDMFLLTVKHSESIGLSMHQVKDKCIHLFASCRFREIDNDLLGEVLLEFERIGLPQLKLKDQHGVFKNHRLSQKV